jgi:hypothetical protein
MQPIRNVHVRRVSAPVERVAPWIESCWSGGDRDCFPRDVIRTWRKNALGVDPIALIPGETLIGHGPFRFRLRAWDGVVWRADVIGRPVGWHGFDLGADGDGCRVTHTLELESSLAARLHWMAIQPIHDWAVESLFDRLDHALRTGVVPERTERPMSRVGKVAFHLADKGLRRQKRRTAGDARGVVATPQLERLPEVDEHIRQMHAPAQRGWAALISTLRELSPTMLPAPLAALWGLQHPTRVGDWTTQIAVGDTIPGFAVAQSEAPRLLTLRGSHRFSSYELRFDLDASRPGCVEIHARTSAAFPGLRGQFYRALVIGSGGHRFVVRRLLAAVARRAERIDGPRPA